MNEAVLPEEARYDGECVLGNKSGLGLRPFCDWTTKRIRAHVVVCCLTLVLAKAAELSNHAKLAFRTSGMRPPLYCQMARCPKEAQEGVYWYATPWPLDTLARQGFANRRWQTWI